MLTVGQVLRDHVVLAVSCVDRLYVNGYVPRLQLGGQLTTFLTSHVGHPVNSPALGTLGYAIGQRGRRRFSCPRDEDRALRRCITAVWELHSDEAVSRTRCVCCHCKRRGERLVNNVLSCCDGISGSRSSGRKWRIETKHDRPQPRLDTRLRFFCQPPSRPRRLPTRPGW